MPTKYDEIKERSHENLAKRAQKLFRRRKLWPKAPDIHAQIEDFIEELKGPVDLWDITEYVWEPQQQGLKCTVVVHAPWWKWHDLREALGFYNPRKWRMKGREGICFDRPLDATMAVKSLSGYVTPEWTQWLRMYWHLVAQPYRQRTMDEKIKVRHQGIRAVYSYGKEGINFYQVAHEYGLKRKPPRHRKGWRRLTLRRSDDPQKSDRPWKSAKRKSV
jgi:hypothetical protein